MKFKLLGAAGTAVGMVISVALYELVEPLWSMSVVRRKRVPVWSAPTAGGLNRARPLIGCRVQAKRTPLAGSVMS